MSLSIEFPQRIFLDSSILQTMLNYGGFLHENEEIESTDPIYIDTLGIKRLCSLRSILQVGGRASFEFALSNNSFREMHQAKNSCYLSWAYDVLDHWNTCLEENRPPQGNTCGLAVMESNSIGYLGRGDRELILDALRFGCDTFLTMENKLPKNGRHLHEKLGMYVESPIHVWARIQPWAALFY